VSSAKLDPAALNPANPDPEWLALMIGNSRLHWAWFQGEQLQQTWDVAHLEFELGDRDAVLSHPLFPQHWRELPLSIASVVASQTQLWRSPHSSLITLADVPIAGLYSSLGIDRAIALFGALQRYRCPVLVIDAGTALTFTATPANRTFLGGAILPGLSLQLRSLNDQTAALPLVSAANLPPRWSTDTADAIRSGVLYGLLAAIQDEIRAWQDAIGAVNGQVVLTGGDGSLLVDLLRQVVPEQVAPEQVAPKVAVSWEPDLVFWGMRAIVYASDSD
jgi:type III pantothenate kinase